MIKHRANFVLIAFIAIALSLPACKAKKNAGLSYDPAGSTDTRSKPINLQELKTYAFADQGVYFDNQFSGARLNEIAHQEDSLFQATIKPENAPINMSPWYAFKVWSEEPRQIALKLSYEDGRHRYHPKISRNKTFWSPLEEERYLPDTATRSATLLLDVSSDTLWVSAQELNPPSQVYSWVEELGDKPWVRVQDIGVSTEGRPLKLMNIGKEGSRHMLVVISGQHPPEITGFKAMQAFVETIAADTELARTFRGTFETVVMPHMNPDGIFHGHWRHNLGGVDLNRDWEFFRQPETKALSKFLRKKVKKQKATVYFGLDFHSTWSDIFYTLDEEDFLDEGSITRSWMNGIAEAFPNYYMNEEPFAAGSPVSKNWFYTEFGAEAITYEVGDNTPRPELAMRASKAAEIMMKLLLQKAVENQ